ncbi:unnamed protein product [Rotaria sp. Silwood1]|nr:unnamed protein product [Rotaria sp. Silwood1]
MAIRASLSSTNSVRRKLALVIGIGDYDKGKKVPNAINDAREMSSALKRIGFIIHENGPQLNLTYRTLSGALNAFKQSINVGDMVLFYFAGHGKQWEDQNYLIPCDNFKEDDKRKVELSGADLASHAINAQHFLMDITSQNPFVIIFFLDCCRTYHLRNEHLTRIAGDEQDNHSRRLKSTSANVGPVIGNARSINANTRPMIANAGYVIAFACAPGTTADDGKERETNGLFTKHILKHILKPNEDIQMMLTDVTNGVVEESESTQIPHITCSLRHRNIYLYEQVTGK